MFAITETYFYKISISHSLNWANMCTFLHILILVQIIYWNLMYHLLFCIYHVIYLVYFIFFMGIAFRKTILNCVKLKNIVLFRWLKINYYLFI